MNSRRTVVSRADLLRAISLAEHLKADKNRFASLLDYYPRPESTVADSDSESVTIVLPHDDANGLSGLAQDFPDVSEAKAPLRARFQAITSCEVLDPSESVTNEIADSTAEPLHKDNCSPRQNGRAPFVPLLRSTRFWPALRQSLSMLQPGKADLRHLVADLARGRLLTRLPRLLRRAWCGELLVVLDISERLQPYFDDYQVLLQEIVTRHGAGGMRLVLVDDVPRRVDGNIPDTVWQRAWVCGRKMPRLYARDAALPLPGYGARVLFLSDLGFMALTPDIAEQWRQIIAALQQANVSSLAWTPCSGRQVEAATTRLAQVYCLDSHTPLRRQSGHVCNLQQRQQIHARLTELRETLLTRLACCLCVQTDMLRAMRLAFSDAASEPALEGLVWSFQPIVRSSLLSRPLAPAHQMTYRKAFARLPPEEQRTILRCMTHWHGWQGRSTEVFETLIWGSHAAPAAKTDTTERKTVASAQQWLVKFRKTMEQSLATDSDLRNFAGDLLARNVNDETLLTAHSQTLAQMWALSGWQTVPKGLRATDVERARTGKSPLPAAVYQLQQVGTELMLWPGDLPVPQRAVSRLGSPLRASGLLIGTASHQHQWIDLHGQCVPLSAGQQISEPLQFIVQGHRYEISQFDRPTWATEWGRDRYGLYAEFTIKTKHGQATQRMRWIEPGTFWMGSPDSENERMDDEGPLHQVTLTRGYWLADTTCTQRLWRVVMGDNPSEFGDNENCPVERVSLNDVQKFLQKLDKLLLYIEAFLPTEAQWEYACRAGTTTPYHFGLHLTSSQANFGRQKGRTVPVKSFPANDWGLFEMHGNVWEWCADRRRTYDASSQQDPEDSGSKQFVRRGGSWFDVAEYARSAFRFANVPGYSGFDDCIGFRLCLRPNSPDQLGGLVHASPAIQTHNTTTEITGHATRHPIRLLHLSDLHFSANTDPVQMLQPLIADLTDRQGLKLDKLDYLVVSGDCTCIGSAEEFERVHQFLEMLIGRFSLSAQRCVLVPGNHDLSWNVDVYDWLPERRAAEVKGLDAERWKKEGKGFLVRRDAEYGNRFENFAIFHHQFTQQPYPLEAARQAQVYIHDRDRLQFIGLNSACRIDEHFPERSAIDDRALSLALQTANEQIDNAVAGKRIPDRDDVLRIAVWHHPITGNEKIFDDAFVQRLQQADVRLCLHGHVHENRADLIGYTYPTRRLHAIGAGSFGAITKDRPDPTPRLYNLIEIAADRSQVRVHTRQMPKTGGAWEPNSVWPDGQGGWRHWYDIPLR